jgi:pimeloyl-ACP methyl ester carboxylesterase
VEARVLENDQVGAGDRPLVLIPGGLTGWQSWLPLVPALSERRRVVRLQSIPNAEGMAGNVGDGSYDAKVERDSIALTLDSLGIEEIDLVGWSNGGRIALDFALAEPERVRSLTAIEPAAWWLVEDRDENARRFGEYIVGCGGRALGARELREFLIGVNLGPPDADFEALPQWEVWWPCRNVLSWCSEAFVRSAETGIEGFERLDVPTLLMRGRATAPWLRSVVDLLGEGISGAVTVELDGGHASLLESPEDFTRALLEHLDGAEARD